jgi:hypothetical protein
MKLKLGDAEVQATQLRFHAGRGGEPWTEYMLEDGAIIRFRAVVSSIVRIDNAWAPNGDPMYQVQSQTVMNVIAPEHLRHQGVVEKAVVQ